MGRREKQAWTAPWPTGGPRRGQAGEARLYPRSSRKPSVLRSVGNSARLRQRPWELVGDTRRGELESDKTVPPLPLRVEGMEDMAENDPAGSGT